MHCTLSSAECMEIQSETKADNDRTLSIVIAVVVPCAAVIIVCMVTIVILLRRSSRQVRYPMIDGRGRLTSTSQRVVVLRRLPSRKAFSCPANLTALNTSNEPEDTLFQKTTTKSRSLRRKEQGSVSFAKSPESRHTESTLASQLTNSNETADQPNDHGISLSTFRFGRQGESPTPTAPQISAPEVGDKPPPASSPAASSQESEVKRKAGGEGPTFASFYLK